MNIVWGLAGMIGLLAIAVLFSTNRRAIRPRVVLADEPTANLDTKTGIEIIDLMHSINREEQTAFIFSSHDPKVMGRTERLIHLQDGKIIGEVLDADEIAEHALLNAKPGAGRTAPVGATKAAF